MELIGKPSINPIIFYSGKISGYIIWILLVLNYFGIQIIYSMQLPMLKITSIIIFLLGIIFVVISIINLGKSIRLGLPQNNTLFKTNGIYKFSRNPMYVGFNLFTIAAIIGTINIFIIIIGIYSILVYHFIILSEEKYLQERFGDEYKKYTKSVRRYI